MKNRTMNGSPVSLKSAVRGALWGVSLGDAYGMPMEMWSREKSRSVFGKVKELLPGHPENAISHGRLAGETTDDSAFTRLVCELIIRNGDVDPMKFVSGVYEWLERGGEKNDLVLGPSTRKALEAIRNGLPPEEAGKSGRTDGAAMRILPVGIVWNWENSGALISAVYRASIATHNTNVAISSAAAVAAAVSCAVRTGDLDTAVNAAAIAADRAEIYGYKVSDVRISLQIERAVRILSRAPDEESALTLLNERIGTGLPAEEAVPAAIGLCSYAKGDALVCARLCANAGGDTDTIGAMACGICGGLRGYDSLPEREIAQIREASGIDWDPVAEALVKRLK